jgi:hypothetical protein
VSALEDAAARRVALSVPSRPEFLGLLRDAGRTAAALAGFGEDDRRRVGDVTQRLAAVLVLAAAHDLLTVDLLCEIVPGGLAVTLHDDGPPFDPAGARDSEAFVRQLIESGSADWVEFRNEGRGGKTAQLLFHHRIAGRGGAPEVTEEDEAAVGGGRDAWELDAVGVEALWELDPADAGEAPPEPEVAAGVTYGVMRPEQAASVSDCMFDTYRLTYLHESMYHPRRIAELNESGALVSFVATAPDGTVVGHTAMSFAGDQRDVAEIGVGAVRRSWRGQHVARRIVDLLMEEAVTRGLYGIYAEGVTVHTITQRINVQLGMGTCGVRLATIPADREFRGLGAQSRHRQSSISMFRYLDQPSALPLEVPERHREMIARLYGWIGAPGRLDGSPPGALEQPSDDSATTDVAVRLHPATSVATISVTRVGADLRERLHAELRRLREADVRVVEASVDMTRSGAAEAAAQLEELGFIFTGILPSGRASDIVTFQFFNGVVVDYDLMKIDSEETRELIAYVRAGDPDAA